MSWVPASDPASGDPAPPRLVVWLALAVCVAGTVMMLVGAWRVGVWTDEPTHVQRYENLLRARLVPAGRRLSWTGRRTPRVARGLARSCGRLALLVPVCRSRASSSRTPTPTPAPYAARLVASIENDYWRVSFRELLPQVPLGELRHLLAVDCHLRVTRCATASPGGRPPAEGSSDCRTDPLGLAHALRRADGTRRHAKSSRTPSWLCSTRAARWKQLRASEYDGAGGSTSVASSMSTVARCDLVLSAYPASGAVLSAGRVGRRVPARRLDLEPGAGRVCSCANRSGSLGFERARALGRDRPLRVVLDGEAADVPEVRVNNEPVVARPTGSGWVLDVPAETVAAMGEGRLVITLAQPAGEQLMLTGVSLEPQLRRRRGRVCFFTKGRVSGTGRSGACETCGCSLRRSLACDLGDRPGLERG